MYTLIIEDRSGNVADEVSFDQGSYTIGRVEGNDIILPSHSVSRQHARIFIQEGRCFIDDLGSANGVMVDGQLLVQRMELRNAAQVRIGDYTLYLEYQDPSVDGGQDVLRTHIVTNEEGTFKLVRVGDMFAGEEFSLTEAVNTIGRTDDNFILLSDPSISRNHAQVIKEGMAFKVIDLGSSNGTRVNGKLVREVTLLRNGDEVQFGNIRFVFTTIEQAVNLAAYARRRNSGGGGSAVIIVVSTILVIVIVVGVALAIWAISDRGSAKREAEKPQVVVRQDPTAELRIKLEEAQTLADMQNWAGAARLAEDVLAVDATFPGAAELLAKVGAEQEHFRILNSGDDIMLEGRFMDARDEFMRIPESSVYHARAVRKLETILQRLATDAYSEGKLACDREPATACVARVCESLAFNPRDEKVKRYLQTLLSSREAKKSAELRDAIQACLDAHP